MRDDVLLSTHLPGLPAFIRGKVRDVYDLGDHLLVVTTDRISAFDSILPTGIPGKGRVLNQLSAYWFRAIQRFCPSHFVSVEAADIQAALADRGVEAPPEILTGRSMLVRKLQALPVECVVRGYLDGSGWLDYQAEGAVCGVPLPPGLLRGSRLPEPIFTPARKNLEGHDENVAADVVRAEMDPAQFDELVRLSLAVYRFGAEHAAARGLILADTKFEFGLLNGQVVMIDEALTPDSSRYYDAAAWKPGGPQPSFDKQFVRDYLNSTGWDHTPPAPPLPPEVAAQTAARYQELYDRITGAPA